MVKCGTVKVTLDKVNNFDRSVQMLNRGPLCGSGPIDQSDSLYYCPAFCSPFLSYRLSCIGSFIKRHERNGKGRYQLWDVECTLAVIGTGGP
eukprot:3393667-Pyramimonas_sp.AAC.1